MANITARLADLSGPWVKQQVNLCPADGHPGLHPYPTLLTHRVFLPGFPGYTERKMKTSPLSKGKDPAVCLFCAAIATMSQVTLSITAGPASFPFLAGRGCLWRCGHQPVLGCHPQGWEGAERESRWMLHPGAAAEGCCGHCPSPVPKAVCWPGTGQPVPSHRPPIRW